MHDVAQNDSGNNSNNIQRKFLMFLTFIYSTGRLLSGMSPFPMFSFCPSAESCWSRGSRAPVATTTKQPRLHSRKYCWAFDCVYWYILIVKLLENRLPYTVKMASKFNNRGLFQMITKRDTFGMWQNTRWYLYIFWRCNSFPTIFYLHTVYCT